MEDLFYLNGNQYAVLHVKSRNEKFDVSKLPDKQAVKKWKQEKPDQSDTKGPSIAVEFKAEKYLASKREKRHSEFEMLALKRDTIAEMIDNTNDEVDLLLFTYNAPCCMRPDKFGDREQDMIDDDYGWRGCDDNSCTGIIARFIRDMEKKYQGLQQKNLRLYVSWFQPYNPQTLKAIPPPNHHIYYTLYFETLGHLSGNRRIELSTSPEYWGHFALQKKMADYVLENSDNVDENSAQPVYEMVNKITQYCVRTGTKKKFDGESYPFASALCLEEAFKDKYPSPSNDEQGKFDLCKRFLVQENAKDNLDTNAWILGPPLNPDQKMSTNEIDYYIINADRQTIDDWLSAT